MARTLLVPGTQATTLLDQNGKTVFNAVHASIHLSGIDLAGRSPDEVGRLLSLEQAPGELAPRRFSLEDGTDIRKGDVLNAPYAGLPFTESFRYDWRADLRWNARILLRFLQDRAPVDGDRWNLIGHSQGGLVIALASKFAGDPADFAKLVGRIAFIGVPFAGTMRATEALLFGRDDLGQQNEVAIRTAARTWPSLYQMLPAWPAVLTKAGNELPEEKQLLLPDGWPGVVGGADGIQPDLLSRARETRMLLSGPFAHLAPNVDVLVVLGKRQMTPVYVVRTGTTLDPKFKMQKGDSLVPAQLTLDHLGHPFRERKVVLQGDVDAHAMLCVDEDVQALLRQFLATPTPP